MAQNKYKIAEETEIIFGSNPTELVQSLMQGSFNPPDSIDDYMRDFAERYEILDGEKIRCDTPENFVEDLIGKGYLIAESEIENHT
jgi:uncharacterized protein YuzB (UPF0349 family)